VRPSSAFPPLAPSPYGRLFRDGHPWVWITRCSTALLLLMVAGIVGLVAWHGLSAFWPRHLVRYELKDGSVVVGEEGEREVHRVGADEHSLAQIQVRVGNRDVYGMSHDFVWLDADQVVAESRPEDLLAFERWESGPAYGRVRQLIEVDVAAGKKTSRVVAEGASALPLVRSAMESAAARRDARRALHEDEVDPVARRQSDVADRLRRLVSTTDPDAPGFPPRKAALEAERDALQREYEFVAEKERAIVDEDARHLVLLEEGSGKAFPKPIRVSQLVRIDAVNQLSGPGRLWLAIGRFWRFVSENPRESNSDGGIWPAIFGTMLMTLLMTIFVVPFGVVAALYLREYAKQGLMISAVRIAVNNLAGVPSIVFGMFGLGFFCYTIGGSIDRQFFSEKLPTPTFGGGGILWASLTMALLTVPVVIVATEEALAAVPRALREAAFACGASRWQMLWRVVIPHASPGILTGAILAMARGAGEVAPLMLTGVRKTVEHLPVDSHAPFVHPERQFMTLGYHILDTGFQAPNVEAARPIVYATSLVLLAVVLLLNMGAILLRNRLRKRMQTGAF
jgi:phosphate transport system permease protein